MRCKETIELMSDHIEGALSGPMEQQVERHLAGCRDCSLYLTQMRMTISLAHILGRIRTPEPGFYRTLLANFAGPREA